MNGKEFHNCAIEYQEEIENNCTNGELFDEMNDILRIYQPHTIRDAQILALVWELQDRQ